MVKHPGDRKSKPQCNYQYWPGVRELHNDGAGGVQYSASLGKLKGYINKNPALFRFGNTISIAENRLAGPFNGVSQVENNRKILHCIPEEA